MRLSTKSFRETKADKTGQIAMKPEFWIFARNFFWGGVYFFFAKILGETPLRKIRAKIQNSGFVVIVLNSIAFISRKDFVDKRIFGGVIRLLKNVVTRISCFE